MSQILWFTQKKQKCSRRAWVVRSAWDGVADSQEVERVTSAGHPPDALGDDILRNNGSELQLPMKDGSSAFIFTASRRMRSASSRLRTNTGSVDLSESPGRGRCERFFPKLLLSRSLSVFARGTLDVTMSTIFSNNNKQIVCSLPSAGWCSAETRRMGNETHSQLPEWCDFATGWNQSNTEIWTCHNKSIELNHKKDKSVHSECGKWPRCGVYITFANDDCGTILKWRKRNLTSATLDIASWIRQTELITLSFWIFINRVQTCSVFSNWWTNNSGLGNNLCISLAW
jgi:hypothetical protein